MSDASYSVAAFVRDLRAAAAEEANDRAIIRRLTPLVRRLAESSDGWLREEHYACDEAQGFGVHVLHEEPDHTLAVFAFSWLPGRGAPPHNHATWGVVAGVDGPERNVDWDRLDDGSRPGYAELRERHRAVIGRGEVISFLPDDIHSVHNDNDRVSVSLHVYGKHVNHTGRLQFDPARNKATPLVVTVQE